MLMRSICTDVDQIDARHGLSKHSAVLLLLVCTGLPLSGAYSSCLFVGSCSLGNTGSPFSEAYSSLSKQQSL
jgi:hypothetical protein